MSRRRPSLVAAVAVVALVTSGLTGASPVTVAGPPASDVRPVPATGAGERVDDPTGAIDDADDSGGVRVGVIGSAFDRSGALSGRVEAHRRLGDRLLAVEGAGEHDTAVAEIVADRSASARLYLVSVGQRPTPDEYDRAVAWLRANDVHIVVDSGSYFPSTAEGMSRIAAAAERAAENGTVFVTSAGNYAERHWRGTPVEHGWVSFAGSAETNPLGNGTIGGTVTLRLYWEGDADYDLYLYRSLPGRTDPVVAKSARSTGGAEAIDATLPDGEYYVGVYARDPGTGSVPVDLFSATHRLAHAGAEGSAVAPATAEGVIAVGATDAGGEIRPYSSDADVTVPDAVSTDTTGRFRGTSAAAPVVAGTVARLEASGSDLTAAEIERAIGNDSRSLDPTALAPAGNATAAAGRP